MKTYSNSFLQSTICVLMESARGCSLNGYKIKGRAWNIDTEYRFFFIKHQKYMFILTYIHTYYYVFLNVYSQRILREIFNILENITDWCFRGWYRTRWVASPTLTFLCFKAVLQL